MYYSKITRCSKKIMEKQKQNIMQELAKLQSLKWASDPEIADSVFPYVLIEAINLLKNSEIVDNPTDFTKTGASAKELLESLYQPKSLILKLKKEKL